MNEIRSLIQNLPDGKKSEYLGSLYIKGLSNYNDKYGESELDLNALVATHFKSLLLKDDIIKDIILFAPEELKSITNYGKTPKTKYIKDIREHLISFFNFEYVVDPVQPITAFNSTDCAIKLHDFQERIRRKVVNLIFNDQKRFLIHMPTGSGKTRTAAEILLDFLRLSSSKSLLNEKIKVLWVAQSRELCHQAYETVKWLIDNKGTQDIEIGHFYEKQTLPQGIEDKSAIIFCGIQKLLSNYKTDPIWKRIRDDNYLVIIDEAHRTVASQWIKAIDYFVSNSSVYLIGLTATPGLGSITNNSYSLSSYYQNNKIAITDEHYTEIEHPISYLVKREFLAKIKRIDIDLDITTSASTTMGENGEFVFDKKSLKFLSTNAERNSSIINIVKENHEKNKILIFSCGIDHNRILKTILKGLNIKCETIDQGSKNRNSIISRFKDGELNVLINFGVLTTGFDAPKTNICVIARPISSVVMYSQMVGRILRGPKNTGNKENTLYTIKDNLGHGDYDKMFNSFNEYYK